MVYLIALSLRPNSAASSRTVTPHSRFAMILSRSVGLIFGPRRAFPATSCPNWRSVGIVMTHQLCGVGVSVAGSGKSRFKTYELVLYILVLSFSICPRRTLCLHRTKCPSPCQLSLPLWLPDRLPSQLSATVVRTVSPPKAEVV
jgi:hypothetical protein